MSRRRDQYGRPIPDDLVLLPTSGDNWWLWDDEIETVLRVDWYEANDVLLASAKALNGLSEDDPIDAGVDLNRVEVCRVADCLKRYSPEDGFYHA